jgi:stage 0 sporulation regulatory protein
VNLFIIALLLIVFEEVGFINRQMHEKLLIEIERKRLEMFELAKVRGIKNEKTIKCSQELDLLLTKYQKCLLISMGPPVSL